MDIRKNIKKLVAIGTGAVLIGATLMGAAAAASLAEYPGMFIKDGQFNGVLVVGESADSSDVVGAINLAVSLQRELHTTALSAAAEGNLGETEFTKNNNYLELGEELGEVTQTLTADDLSMLAGGSLRTSAGRTDYSQYLKVGDVTAKVVYEESEDEVVGDFLKLEEYDLAFEYELQFQSGFESELDDGELEDFMDEEFVFLGEKYDIMDATLDGTEITLTLVTGSAEGILAEGETQTFEVGDEEYEVKALIISDSTESVKFVINGETSKKLYEGDSYKLEDGTELIVKEIMTNEGSEANGADIVEFYLGAGKLVLTDSDYTDENYSESVELNEDMIDGASVKFEGSLEGDDFKLHSLGYKFTVEPEDDPAYVPAGGTLAPLLDNAEGLFGLDLAYEGLDVEYASTLEFSPSGDDAYKLSFETIKGAEYSIPLVDNSDGFKFGTDDENLVFVEGEEIFKKDLFILSDDTDDEANTYVFKYEGVNKNDELVLLKDLEGDRYQVSFTGGEGELVLNGHAFPFTVDDGDVYQLQFDHNGDGELGEGHALIVLKGGAVLDLGDDNHPEGEVELTLTTAEDKFDTEDGDEVLSFTLVGDDDEVDMSVDGLDLHNHEDDDDLSSGMSRYGTLVEIEDERGDPAHVEISYPTEQAKAKVFLRGNDYVEPVSASFETVSIVGAIFDSEVESLGAQNMIVVGGPCANTVAAELLGSSAETCTEGFEEGKAIIKLIENGDKVAMVVAGYSALDTRRATKVLSQFDKYDFDGSEVVVEGTTLNDATVVVPEVQ